MSNKFFKNNNEKFTPSLSKTGLFSSLHNENITTYNEDITLKDINNQINLNSQRIEALQNQTSTITKNM